MDALDRVRVVRAICEAVPSLAHVDAYCPQCERSNDAVIEPYHGDAARVAFDALERELRYAGFVITRAP